MPKAALIAILLLLGHSALPEAATAAQDSLRFGGRIQDPQGHVIPGATVRLQSGGSVRREVSDRQGGFLFTGLPPGEYRILIEMPGFSRYQEVRAIDSDLDSVLFTLLIQDPSQTVVVTATLPEFVQQITVDTRQIEQRRTTDIGQYLRSEPGLAAVRRGAISMDPVVRGLREGQVALLVNDTRTFAAGPARMDSGLSHISPHIIQTLRAVKGPYALSWGAGALSAIQVETFRPPFFDEWEFHGKAGYSYGENAVSQDAYGNFWGGDDRMRFHLFYNRREGNDYRDGDGQLIPGDYESDDVNWSLGFRLSDETVFEYVGGYQEQNDVDFPGRILDATNFLTRSHAFNLKWRPSAPGLVSEIGGQFYVNRKDHLMNNDEKPTARDMPGRTPPFAIRVDLPTESNTMGGNAYVVLQREQWRYKLGFDFFNSDQKADRFISRRSNDRLLFSDIVWPDSDINDQGLFGQALYEGERGQIGAALRIDFLQSDAGQVSQFFLDNTTGDLDQDETNVSASISGRYRVNDFWALSAGLGRAVRSANALERYSDRFPSTRFQIAAEFMGNPDIDPEQSLEFNLGNEFSLGGAFIQIEAFWRRIDDYITIQADPDLPKRLPLSPPTVFRYINGSEATFYGAEGSASRDFGLYVNGRASLSWVWAEDDLFDEGAIGTPPLSGLLGIEFHSPNRRHWVDFSVTLVDEQVRVAASRLETRTPGYAVFDLRAQTELPWRWVLRAGLENIGGRTYSNHLNSLNPFTRLRIAEIGRSFYIGMEYSF